MKLTVNTSSLTHDDCGALMAASDIKLEAEIDPSRLICFEEKADGKVTAIVMLAEENVEESGPYRGRVVFDLTNIVNGFEELKNMCPQMVEFTLVEEGVERRGLIDPSRINDFAENLDGNNYIDLGSFHLETTSNWDVFAAAVGEKFLTLHAHDGHVAQVLKDRLRERDLDRFLEFYEETVEEVSAALGLQGASTADPRIEP